MRQGVAVQIVGREAERTELATALADAASGRGNVVLQIGEAGIGKSTLAAWAAARAAEQAMQIAQGGCSAAGMPALWPLRRALADIAPTVQWREDHEASAGSDRELLAATVVEAIAAAARDRPLLIVLEDLHWADPASLLVTRAIADAVAGLRVVLLLTVRDDPDEVAAAAREHLGQLPTHARRMVLPPLDHAAVAALAEQMLVGAPSEQDVSDLQRRTGGNPFFVHEVLRLQAQHGTHATLVVPPGVREVIQRRVARVTQPCAALLAVAAIAAESNSEVFEPDLIADDADVAPLIDEAESARLIDGLPTGHAFRHALIREVISLELPPAERARLHALVATRLERRSNAQDAPARLAHHWARAHDRQAGARSAFWSLQAARAAVAEYGFETAAEHFRRALTADGTDQVALRVELGEALQLSGEIEAARAELLRAAREAEAAGRPVELARAALALGGGLAGFEVPHSDDAQATLLTRAAALLPDAERALRAAVLGRLSLAGAATMPAVDRIATAERAVQLARDAGDAAVESAVLAAYCDAIAGPDFVRQRLEAAARMVELTEPRGSLHDRTTLLLARRILVVAHLEAGELGAAETQALAYERTAARLGIPLFAWLPEIWRGMRALLVGDTEAALRRAVVAEEIGRRAQSINARLMVFTLRMQAHLDRNTPDEFAPTVRELMDEFAPLGMPAMYLAAPGRFLLAAGDPDMGRSVLRSFGSGDPAEMPKDAEWLEAHWAMTDIAIALDDGASAERLYAALLPYGHLWAVDGIGGALFGAVSEQLGRLARHLGRDDDARTHLATAREQYERQGTPALLRRVQPGEADRPSSPRIRRAGATWSVEWQGRRTTVPDAKGLHDLAALLTRPNQPVPAVDLVEAGGGPSAAAVGGSLGPVLDETARRAYRSRIDELDAELAAAEAGADLGRVERIRVERTMLIDELAAAVGLGGRSRIAGDRADRARKAVTMRIRAAIRTIERHDPALARHLTNAVHTGRLCSYQPDLPVTWQT
jgi:tetratricopeptide (TPR) repeat protein